MADADHRNSMEADRLTPVDAGVGSGLKGPARLLNLVSDSRRCGARQDRLAGVMRVVSWGQDGANESDELIQHV